MFFSHLLEREDLLAEVGQLEKFLLNLLQAFMSLAMSDLGLGSIGSLKPVRLILLADISDFRAETRNLFAKNFQMIHEN